MPRSLALAVSSRAPQLMAPTTLAGSQVSKAIPESRTSTATTKVMQPGRRGAGIPVLRGFLLSPPVPGNAMVALPSARWMPMPFLAYRDAWTLGAIQLKCENGSNN
ncbi:hypothetical protein MB901379_03933 [Mycobacterium basiliense]|uniref:Uncharacterized protein n=1 Tax=Mycobacterium basiliense TaxID=2094119 RepID=A0A3S4BKQ2_9MYCO|nr:hypothetical protein MB901379_03933 [Mycobacterium basiliense]